MGAVKKNLDELEKEFQDNIIRLKSAAQLLQNTNWSLKNNKSRIISEAKKAGREEILDKVEKWAKVNVEEEEPNTNYEGKYSIGFKYIDVDNFSDFFEKLKQEVNKK